MANLYCLAYTFTVSSQTINEQEMFQAADDTAAQTEADSRTDAVTNPMNIKLFNLGAEI